MWQGRCCVGYLEGVGGEWVFGFYNSASVIPNFVGEGEFGGDNVGGEVWRGNNLVLLVADLCGNSP